MSKFCRDQPSVPRKSLKDLTMDLLIILIAIILILIGIAYMALLLIDSTATAKVTFMAGGCGACILDQEKVTTLDQKPIGRFIRVKLYGCFTDKR